MTHFNDFNSADNQTEFDLIPKGTLAKAHLMIKPGGYNDENMGWTDAWATQSDSGAIYLNCEFIIVDGAYTKRRIFSLIGLHSPKGETWANMGRSFIKGILNSANNIMPKDNSELAQNARRISGFGDLNGLEFIARIDVEKDNYGNDKNVIKLAITPDHKEYAALMGVVSNQQQSSSPQVNNNLPNWAK